MNFKSFFAVGLSLLCASLSPAHADPDRTELAVWANEAVVATYTYDYTNFNARQKEIARYFTANGWIAYSNALNASKLPDTIQKNKYEVSAVATQPPRLIILDPTHWIATMNILVVYQNPQYQQQQSLRIVLGFSPAPDGQGVRGMYATSMQTTVVKPPCQCALTTEDSASPTTTAPQ
jgi:hypothetical protein